MSESFLNGRVELWAGDCLDMLARLEECSIDAVVTDPPYGLQFMGREWDKLWRNGTEADAAYVEKTVGKLTSRARKLPDYSASNPQQMQAWHEQWTRAVLRVLKPGGYLLAFGGTRTFHRLACAIEDAGFEVRDMCSWVFGSGFPKSHDVSKAIDKAAPRKGMFEPFARHYAAQRKSAGLTHNAICAAGGFFAEHNHGGASTNWEKGHNVPTVAQWQVLQPLLGLSMEWLPLIERVEAEREKIGERKSGDPVAWYGQAERGDGIVDITSPATDAARQWAGFGTALKPALEPICVARKPLSEPTIAANVLKWGTGALNIDGCRVAFTSDADKASWKYGAAGKENNSDLSWKNTSKTIIQNDATGRWPANVIHDGSDEVVGAFPNTTSGLLSPHHKDGGKTDQIYGAYAGRGIKQDFGGDSGSAARFFYTAKADAGDRLGSKHPTVKPLDLMQYLCRLVCPPNGLVLDPFAGTGTTGEAAFREGMRAILIEREEEYQADIRRRMKLVLGGPEERARESIKAKLHGKPIDNGPLFAEAAE